MFTEELRSSKAFMLVIVGIVLLTVFGLGYGIYTKINQSDKISITIDAVPSDAKITVNGKTVQTGTSHVNPGTYTVKATKDGFADFSESLTVGQDKQLVPILLAPVSVEAKQWARDNQPQYRKLEAKAGAAAAEQGEAFQEKNPIVQHLPYTNLLYSIGYRRDPDDTTGNSIIIEIDAANGYRQTAIYQLYQWGFDPTDFTIRFRNYQDPFTS